MDIREITKQNKQKDTANAMSLCWVPGGTRTHDIQNHNLPWISLYHIDFHHVNEFSLVVLR